MTGIIRIDTIQNSDWLKNWLKSTLRPKSSSSSALSRGPPRSQRRRSWRWRRSCACARTFQLSCLLHWEAFGVHSGAARAHPGRTQKWDKSSVRPQSLVQSPEQNALAKELDSSDVILPAWTFCKELESSLAWEGRVQSIATECKDFRALPSAKIFLLRFF